LWPAISVVVVAFRQRDALLECLTALQAAAARVSGGTELIVVDNGDLAALVRERIPEVKLLEPGANSGFAGGVNLGLAAATGRWIALVNDDARVEADTLALLLAVGESDRRIGSVAAQVRFEADQGRINSAGIDVDSLGVAIERLSGRVTSEAAQAGEVFGASGSCALYRAAMLEQLGGLDERFFAYLEDVDLAWRARAVGWIAVYEPRAIAYHRGSASSGAASSRKYFLVGRNRVRLLARNATTGQLLRALPGIVLYDSAYIAYVALTVRTLAPLRGRLAGLRDWAALRAETRSKRSKVTLSPACRGWLASLRQHRSYQHLAAQSSTRDPA
jgi:GT2 family glycosyltransferase